MCFGGGLFITLLSSLPLLCPIDMEGLWGCPIDIGVWGCPIDMGGLWGCPIDMGLWGCPIDGGPHDPHIWGDYVLCFGGGLFITLLSSLSPSSAP